MYDNYLVTNFVDTDILKRDFSSEYARILKDAHGRCPDVFPLYLCDAFLQLAAIAVENVVSNDGKGFISDDNGNTFREESKMFVLSGELTGVSSHEKD